MTNLSRRHLVTTAAALPALAVPALAAEAEHDPVIAMVENSRAAWAGIAIPEPADENGRPAFGTPAHDEFDQKQADALAEFNDLEFEMLETGPRTKAGAAAMIRYHLEINHDLLDAEGPLLTSLLRYLDAAGVQS